MDAVSSRPAQPAYQWMDAARFAAAGLVCISHVRALILDDYVSGLGLFRSGFYLVTGLGEPGVILFFVLSGFWIAKTTTTRATAPRFITDYLIDRTSRLYIVLVPTLFVTLFADLIAINILHSPLHAGTAAWVIMRQPVTDFLTLKDFVGNLLFLQRVLVHPFGSNGPLWSLAYEFWFYIVFPGLWLLLKYRKPTWLLAGLAVFVINPELALGFLLWLVGVGLYFVHVVWRRKLSLRWARHLLVPAMGLFVAALVRHRIEGVRLFDPVLAISFAAALYLLLELRMPLPRWLDWMARYGAQSSFSLYAIHLPIGALAAAVIIGPARLSASPGNLGLVVAVTIGLILIGGLFARATEARTGLLRDWLRVRLPGSREAGAT